MNALPATPFDRRDERTHLFLVATLDAGSASGAVRVRNLSPTGALVEAPQLPSVGTAVTLRRGSLEAAGTVVWAEAGRAGLSFAAPVFVGAWLPTGNASRQAKVDKMVHGLKQGERPAAIVPAIVPVVVPAVAPDPADASATLAMADLVRLRGELEHLGTTLARDAMVASAHPELQFFATAGQRLARIIAALRP